MSPRRVALVAVAISVVVLAGVAAAHWPRPSPMEKALAILDDEDRFTTALEATDAFAEISVVLEAVDCDAQRVERCARTYRAAAWARVSAVFVVTCPPASVFEARAGLGGYLRGNGELPPTPRCGARRQASA
jgi:hypothetical protein